jgi:hypothetical protein
MNVSIALARGDVVGLEIGFPVSKEKGAENAVAESTAVLR